jgi:hypothetical protein
MLARLETSLKNRENQSLCAASISILVCTVVFVQRLVFRYGSCSSVSPLTSLRS